MTNIEAILLLSDIRAKYNCFTEREKYHSLSMGIEALRGHKSGKWRLYSPFTDTYECDECGYQVIDESFCTNYCPNCGATMEGE